jgi:hypothetical protein
MDKPTMKQLILWLENGGYMLTFEPIDPRTLYDKALNWLEDEEKTREHLLSLLESQFRSNVVFDEIEKGLSSMAATKVADDYWEQYKKDNRI